MEACLSIYSPIEPNWASGRILIGPKSKAVQAHWGKARRTQEQRKGQMIIFKPNPHRLQVTPSQKDPGRFDWSITRDDVVVRQSVRSFGSEGASAANGDAALREITALWQGAR